MFKSPARFEIVPDWGDGVLLRVVYFGLVIFGTIVSESLVPLLILLSSSVLHETGHYIAFLLYDIEVNDFLISPVSGHVEVEANEYKLSPQEKFVCAFAGPVAGVLPILPVLFFIDYISPLALGVSIAFLLQSTLQIIPSERGTDGYFILDAIIEVYRGERLADGELVDTIYWKILIYVILALILVFIVYSLPISVI